jgi:hypothetical protein
VPIAAAAALPAVFTSVEAAGERRYLTVMLCDLVDSTGISAKLDAEEWRDLVGAYLDAASATTCAKRSNCWDGCTRRGPMSSCRFPTPISAVRTRSAMGD